MSIKYSKMEIATKQPQKFKKREQKLSSIYSRMLVTRNIMLPINAIGKNIKQTLEDAISMNYEGKCVAEGFIKKQSSKIVTYSSGTVERGFYVSFHVVFECDVCFPVEGMLIHCIAKNITKAGVRAISADEVPSPIDVFLARDHHYMSNDFNEIKEGDDFNVRVIGQRFELNDKQISVIAEFVKPRVEKEIPKTKPKLVIENY
jgi:DNA-directed RNA polymerase subunit E'/Rpb7